MKAEAEIGNFQKMIVLGIDGGEESPDDEEHHHLDVSMSAPEPQRPSCHCSKTNKKTIKKSQYKNTKTKKQ